MNLTVNLKKQKEWKMLSSHTQWIHRNEAITYCNFRMQIEWPIETKDLWGKKYNTTIYRRHRKCKNGSATTWIPVTNKNW